MTTDKHIHSRKQYKSGKTIKQSSSDSREPAENCS